MAMATKHAALALGLCCLLALAQDSDARSYGRSNQCGRRDYDCCEGGECNNNLFCFFGICKACGGNGQLCCPPSDDEDGGRRCEDDPTTGEEMFCAPYDNKCRACGTSAGSPCCEDSALPCNPNNYLMCMETTVNGEETKLCVTCGGVGEPCCPNPDDGNEMLGCEYGCTCVELPGFATEKVCVSNSDLVSSAMADGDSA